MRRTRRPEARPDEILDAALAAFSELGFAGARIEDVAARAGLSKGAVYLYFESKEALLKALVRRLADRVVGAAENLAASDGVDAEKTLRSLLTYMALQLSNPRVSAAPRIVIAEAQRFPEIASYYRSAVIDRAERLLAGLIDRGVAQGVFRDIDRAVALRGCAGPMLVHMLLSTVFKDPGNPGPDPEILANGIADVILNGLKAKDGASP
ncbi:MAG: TetR/AcrR family transcriptional regulator [Proteobacteria bacterium]|nr:TetR/AcrR family transcriptional regulator [Pseudomonadota bacterium]